MRRRSIRDSIHGTTGLAPALEQLTTENDIIEKVLRNIEGPNPSYTILEQNAFRNSIISCFLQ